MTNTNKHSLKYLCHIIVIRLLESIYIRSANEILPRPVIRNLDYIGYRTSDSSQEEMASSY